MNVTSSIRNVLGAAALACMAAPALAVPVTYTFTGTGSGSLGGTAFTDASFTISAVTDTDLVATTSQPSFTLHETAALTGASLAINGFGAASFSAATRFFSAYSAAIGGIGFGEAPVASALGLDYLDIVDNTAIGYDMRSDFGPLTVATVASTALAQFSNIGTSLGSVTFRDITNVTFTAVTAAQTVPEPTTLALVLAAAAAGTAAARRRQA